MEQEQKPLVNTYCLTYHNMIKEQKELDRLNLIYDVLNYDVAIVKTKEIFKYKDFFVEG